VVGVDWPWFGQYGDELLEELKKLNIPPMQPKPQQKRAEKRTAHELEEERSQGEQPAAKKRRGQKQVAPAQNPTPTAVTINTAPPSHSTTPAPGSIGTLHPYAMHQHYATPQLSYNPYTFLRYPYAMPPPTPFYGHFQTLLQPAVHNLPSSSNVGPQNPNISLSSTGARNGGDT